MTIKNLLTETEIKKAQVKGIVIPNDILANVTVKQLTELYSCIDFKLQDPKTDGHIGGQVLNELHKRKIASDFFPAKSLDESIALSRKDQFKSLIDNNSN